MSEAASLARTETLERKGEKYERLIGRTKKLPAISTVVVHPCDRASLAGVVEAARAEIVRPTLVGPRERIEAVASEHDLDISPYEIVEAPHSHAAAERGVALLREGRGEEELQRDEEGLEPTHREHDPVVVGAWLVAMSYSL